VPKSRHGTFFVSVKQLREHIDAFIETYNQNGKPFVWTKAKVHQRRVKDHRTDVMIGSRELSIAAY